jgi:hypothetical protein
LISQKNKDLHHLTINKARIADRYQQQHQGSRESLHGQIMIQDEKDLASRDDLVVVVTGEDAPAQR